MKFSKIYDLSYQYLLDILPKELVEKDLEKYFNVETVSYSFLKDSSLKDIFERLISSAQNYQGMPNYINFKERNKRIKELLHNYDLKWIAGQNTMDLYNLFKKEYKITPSNNIKQNSWYKWSNSIIDSANFVNEFKSVDEFEDFIKPFDYNLATRTALPLLISEKIRGMGFTLVCDFLKELGYLNYVKPDTHLMDICSETGLCDKNNIKVFETVVKIANESNITPYKLDKILWLICSGNFYLHEKNNKSYKKEFIEYLKEYLNKKKKI